MKRIILILTLFLIFINTVFAAPSTVLKEFSVPSVDGFGIKADLEYPKVKNKREFSTVVLLHSLGYSSEWWGDLPQELLNNGYAVLKIDLRGHGKSVYNSKLVRNSWKDMTKTAYAKYPEDVVKVIEHIKTENPKIQFFKKWAIVGSDIGANTAVLTAEKVSYRPQTLVLLSPTVKARGLYVPVRLAHLDNVDIFSISGTNDTYSQKCEKYLQKFAQAVFVTYVSQAKTTGMLMLRSDKSLSKVITTWLKDYL